LLALAGLASASFPAAAQLVPSTSAQIAEAAVDCWSIISAGPVDQAKLKTKGWVKGSIKAPKGQAVESGLEFYGKSGSGTLVLVSPRADARGCTVLSRTVTAEAVSASIPLMLAGFKAIDPAVEVKKVSAQEVGFFALPKAALLALTGKPTEPGVRIQVSYTAQEKK
jgi:hypothetical protein